MSVTYGSMGEQMGSAKFAAITSDLLARKGDAAPSVATMPARPSIYVEAASPRPVLACAAANAPAGDPADNIPQPQTAGPQKDAKRKSEAGKDPQRPRRVMISLTADEFEKLGIAAIKKNTTRHQIARAALDAYFLQLAAELPRACNCMAEGPCCS